MMNNVYDKYNRTAGYGQMAPGRDLPEHEEPGQPGRPPSRGVINTAIGGGMPMGGLTPFNGATQTIGASPQKAVSRRSVVPTAQPMGTGIGAAIMGTQTPMRTADFRDSNNNGRDDRDERQVSAPGFMAPGQTLDQPLQQPASSGPFDLLSTLNKYGYGAQALDAAAPELEAAGYQVQAKNAEGWRRGRIKDPQGNILDLPDPREGRTAQNNWANNPVANGQWSIVNRGHESQADSGGWSFGGGGMFMPSPMQAPSQQEQLLAAIQGAPQDQGQTYSETMRQQLLEAISQSPELRSLLQFVK